MIVKLQMAALLLCLSRLLVPAALVLAVMAMLSGEQRHLLIALALGGGAAVLAVLRWMFAAGGKCPLCTMPVLLRKGCSKHRHATCIAGSYRMPVAFGILFKGQFRCPYCNEPTMLAVREPTTSRRS